MSTKVKQSLTFVLTSVLSLFMLISTASAVSYVKFYLKKHTPNAGGYFVFLGLICATLLSLWLSNQRTENKTLKIFCLILFWLSIASTLSLIAMLCAAYYRMALMPSRELIPLKIALPFVAFYLSVLIGVWRYKKSSAVKLHAGFASGAAILLASIFILNVGFNKAPKKRMSHAPTPITLNVQAPPLTGSLLTGETVTLEKLKGKVVVLDFWATWCGPCMLAMPVLQKVHTAYEQSSDVAIIAVNCWERTEGKELKERLRIFADTNGYTFPILLADDSFPRAYGVQGIPTQFFIDKKGILRISHVGFSGGGMEEEMKKSIEKLR